MHSNTSSSIPYRRARAIEMLVGAAGIHPRYLFYPVQRFCRSQAFSDPLEIFYSTRLFNGFKIDQFGPFCLDMIRLVRAL
jgi:hypothetical protein